MGKSAVEYFSEVPRRCNCAQSVAAGAGREDLIPEMASMGGGRAPEGRCGALYAALQLLPEARRDAAVAAFCAKVGSDKCREIKAGTGPSCLDCVRFASELVSGRF